MPTPLALTRIEPYGLNVLRGKPRRQRSHPRSVPVGTGRHAPGIHRHHPRVPARGTRRPHDLGVERRVAECHHFGGGRNRGPADQLGGQLCLGVVRPAVGGSVGLGEVAPAHRDAIPRRGQQQSHHEGVARPSRRLLLVPLCVLGSGPVGAPTEGVLGLDSALPDVGLVGQQTPGSGA